MYKIIEKLSKYGDLRETATREYVHKHDFDERVSQLKSLGEPDGKWVLHIETSTGEKFVVEADC